MKNKITLFMLLINFTLFAQQVRIMSYNLENYQTSTSRDSSFKKVINQIKPDILVVVEMLSQQGINQFLNNSLNAEYSAAPVKINNDTWPYNNCGFYFKNSVITLLQTTTISADPRVISEFKLVHNITKDTLIIFGVHLKAYLEDSTRRANAVVSLRNRTAQLNSNTNYLVCGDFNIFASTESAFKKLVDKTSPGYFIDPMNVSGNWNKNPELTSSCTWSTYGGINTRFDMILISQALNEVGEIDYVPNSFKIFGNDGTHFYTAVNSGTNAWFPNDSSIGNALVKASDHLPVYADFKFGVVPNGVSTVQTLPTKFELMQNYPNPFNPETIIRYQLPVSGYVSLKVYNLLGSEVITLVNEFQNAGIHNSQFSILNMPVGKHSSALSSSVYFYQLKVGNFVQTKKMILIK